MWCEPCDPGSENVTHHLHNSRFGSSNLLAKMRQIFSLCFELYASEFFEEQSLFENLLKLEDLNGQTVLYHAIRSGEKECVQLLLSHNISPIDRFDSEKVQPSTCFCGVRDCGEPATRTRGASNSRTFCVCQPSHRLFPFLIMSLDLRPIIQTSCRQTVSPPPEMQRPSQGQLPPPNLCFFLSLLSHAQAHGSYRMVDVDIYNISADDSKRMWRRCRDNIVSFADTSAKDAGSLQFGNQMHMSLNSLDNKGKGALQMHSSFKIARKQFQLFQHRSVSPNANAADIAHIHDEVAPAIQRLMFFSFCLFSDGWQLETGWQAAIKEMRDYADVAVQRLNYEMKQWSDKRKMPSHTKCSIFAENSPTLDETSSLMFMFANSLFNCCVALKMSHCTQARFHHFVFVNNCIFAFFVFA